MQQERIHQQQVRSRPARGHAHRLWDAPTPRTARPSRSRSTDGSHRVIVPKQTSTASASTTRPRSPSRRNGGANNASTNATFSPETAVR